MEKHPITPPSPELAAQWVQEIYGNPMVIPLREPTLQVIERAAQWGADQELEACCEWIPKATPWDAEQLRAARRPKPPSLKEQALQALSHLLDGAAHSMDTTEPADYIRRALEQLDD